MKHVFIINPTAGKSDSRQKIYDMAEKLRQDHGLEVQCLLTKKQGHATEIARRLCQSGEDLRFYACGGDGTVNEVANGIIGYDNASMTVIPMGTGNDFLKNFGPEDMEKFRDAEICGTGPIPIDAIEVNDRIALTIACSGIDATVAKDVHNFSESPILDGKSSYIVSLAVNFLFKGIGSHWTVDAGWRGRGGGLRRGGGVQRALLRRRLHAGGGGPDGRRCAEHPGGEEGKPQDLPEVCQSLPQGQYHRFPIWPDVPPQGDRHRLGKAGHHYLPGRRVYHL